ncbi:hypothetical protein JTE90_016188 [Oedothorax gibbosus]|uniref:Uncharacterized protein n=1 Tax=Oedothorax gibbosus TaxID=931172 RepID=A0AAV6U8U3_9ARAC|nr:hypothetical protein JTE90_016188 [Oedothorax gibbosus]
MVQKRLGTTTTQGGECCRVERPLSPPCNHWFKHSTPSDNQRSGKQRGPPKSSNYFATTKCAIQIALSTVESFVLHMLPLQTAILIGVWRLSSTVNLSFSAFFLIIGD